MTASAAPALPGWAWERIGTYAQLAWPLWLFIVSMVIPADLDFEISGLRLSPQRLVLLACAAGILRWLLRNRDLHAHDLCMIAAGSWAVLATFANMAFLDAVERGGAFFLETAVAYLLPVAYLTSALQMRVLIRTFFAVILVLAPLAAIEALIAEHFIADLAAEWMEKDEPFLADERLGLLRARVTFSHQILFGIFCASLLAFFWLETVTLAGRIWRGAVCFTGVFFSLSTAALLLLLLQIAMLAIDRLSRPLRNRVVWLAGAAFAGWAAIELAVQGGVPGFVTRYLSLNPATAYYRQLIWMHVSDDIAAEPWLGTGGDWTRPSWMIASIDHLYYAKALSYGVPTIALIVLAAVLIGLRLFGRPEDPAAGGGRVRRAWLFSILGLAIAGLTVDYFGRALPFAMFIIGLGAAQIRIAERYTASARRVPE